jgi:hypothetical protein
MWAIVTTERPSSVVRTLTFDILINSSEATGPILVEWSLGGPLSELCSTTPAAYQDGHCY